MKVTEESIKAKIKAVHYFRPLGTLTLCVLELANGYKVIGKSACVDAAQFDQRFGEELAYKDAFRKVWPLEGYLFAEQRCCALDALQAVKEALQA